MTYAVSVVPVLVVVVHIIHDKVRVTKSRSPNALSFVRACYLTSSILMASCFDFYLPRPRNIITTTTTPGLISVLPVYYSVLAALGALFNQQKNVICADCFPSMEGHRPV